MKANVGGIDRILRLVLGAVLVVLAAMNVIGLWGYIGVVVLVTGLVGWCPAYLPFGFTSCKTGKP